MTFNTDFIRDAASRCAEMLAAAGYSYPSSDDRETIRTYESVKHRRIVARQRTIHKAQYTVPSHLVAGEQNLLAKVAAGDDLWPHQSRKITNVSTEDGMLNDFGIQHFHLGILPDSKHTNLIEGTKEILFAIVKPSDFYSIGIFDHSAWSKQSLLDIIESNWPEITDPYKIKGGSHMKPIGLAVNYTDAEAKILRENGINTLRQSADESIGLNPGGGVTLGKQSFAVSRSTIALVKTIEIAQITVQQELQKMVADGSLTPDGDVRLEWQNDAPYALIESQNTRIKLPPAWTIPAL